MVRSQATLELPWEKGADVSPDFYEANASEYASRTRDLGKFPGLERELLQFASSVPPGGLILDVGSGSGRDSHFFADRGFKVLMLDRSEPLLLEAQRFVGAGDTGCLVADLRRLPLRDHAVNGVWASGSLLHLAREEIQPAMLGVRRILTPRGCFGISMKVGTGDEMRPDGRRFTYVSEAEMLRYATSAGFSLIDCIGPYRKMWITFFFAAE